MKILINRYKYVNNNPSIRIRDVAFTNDPFIIAQMPKMVAINSAIEIDITGQVVSDSIGSRIFSGFGGQVDFVAPCGQCGPFLIVDTV